ncbi:MAG: efflux RND transporter periplasmic adaptor subunit [Coxiellaceae bacterium]|nr:efflux RND transporter periplasmic adaptor subunit [Coxiellaceae bacterium]
MKTVFKIILSACLISTIVACSNDDDNKPKTIRPVKSIVLGDSQSTLERHFPGKVLASKRAELSFEVPGKLVKLPIKKGEKIKKGQLLAQLDQIPFEDKAQQTQAHYDYRKVQFHRGKELVKGNYISKAEYDKLQSAYQVAEANLSTAKRNLKDSTLRAPFDGIVADRYVENHEQVKEKQVLMSFHDIEYLDIETHVPEKFMLKIKESEREKDSNDKAKTFVVFDIYPKKRFPVLFKEFAAQSDPDTQTYAIVFKMAQPDEINVLPGMSVTVYAKISSKHYDYNNYYSLPIGAVFTESNQQSYVWLVSKDMTVKKQPVTMGQLQNKAVEITSGLKPGDRVVTAGVHFLRENQKVTLPKEGSLE